MDNMSSKLPLKEWEETINKMSYDELQEYIDYPDVCYSDFLELVKERLIELKEIRNTVIRILEELGCQCEMDGEGNIDFRLVDGIYTKETELFFKEVDFYICFDEYFNYIEIHECGWKEVDLDNIDEIENLKCAINEANFGYGVSTAYHIQEKEQVMKVYSTTNLPYLPDESYLKKYLDYKLCDIFCANKLVDHYLEVIKENN